MKRLLILFILILIAAVLTSCASFGIVSDIVSSLDGSDSTPASSSEWSLLTSKDGKFSAMMPGKWKEMEELHEEAELEMGSDSEGVYMIGLMEAKEDLAYTFEEWATVCMDNTISTLENFKISDPVDVTVNGYPAEQYILSGTVEKINVKYLITYIDGEKYYGQILCWSLVSDFEDAQETFSEIVQSLKGI